MKVVLRFVISTMLLVAAVSTAAAGGMRDDKPAPAAAKASGGPVRTVYAAHTQGYVPYGFVNEKGESDGFEIAVLRAVDAVLDEYAFAFVPTSDEDLLIGIESGKYALGTKGAWVTAERKKKFLFPENPVAASIIGITFRASDADKIRDLESFARFSGKLVPISPQSAQFALVQEFNKSHPDSPVALVPSDTFIINDAYLWVIEGRYDAFFDLKLAFQNSVVSEKGAFHSLADRLAWVPYKGIPTWTLFNRNETELAAAYDRAIEQLRADGTLSALSVQYFGEDVFSYVFE